MRPFHPVRTIPLATACCTLLLGSCLLGSATTLAADSTLVKLSATQIKSAGITVARATAPGNAATGTGNTLRLSGTVEVPNRGIEVVSATAAGQLQAVLVNVGESVRRGTPLARVYSAELLGLQRAYLQARSSATLSSQKAERDATLFKDGIIAASRVDESRSADLQAQAAVQEQRHLLKLAGMSEAAINGLKQASDINPVQTISAGLNGVVLEQTATPGARVEPGEPLFRLGNTQTLWVALQATQQQLGQLAVGDAVKLAGCAQTGKIIAISPQVSRNSQTALVRAEFSNAASCLRPNQFAEVQVSTRGLTHVVGIPASALLRSGGKDQVFVQTAAGFQLQDVTVVSRQSDVSNGSGDNNLVWVSDALPAGTQVAVSGVAALRGAASGLGAE